MVVLLIAGAVVFLGWWGIRAADRQLDKLDPAIDDMKGTIEKMNQESEEWEKKSKDLRESLPSEEELMQDYQQ